MNYSLIVLSRASENGKTVSCNFMYTADSGATSGANTASLTGTAWFQTHVNDSDADALTALEAQLSNTGAISAYQEFLSKKLTPDPVANSGTANT